MRVTDDQIISAAATAKSMMSAAAILGVHFNTFKTRATKLGVYSTNQSGKGVPKPSGKKIPLVEILNGEHPQYQSNKLRIRLFEENIKQRKCEICGIENWLGKPVALELHHVNGDRTDHRLVNLEVICPMCHSQTETFRGKNIK